MAIFNSYVKLPEGKYYIYTHELYECLAAVDPFALLKCCEAVCVVPFRSLPSVNTGDQAPEIWLHGISWGWVGNGTTLW